MQSLDNISVTTNHILYNSCQIKCLIIGSKLIMIIILHNLIKNFKVTPKPQHIIYFCCLLKFFKTLYINNN